MRVSQILAGKRADLIMVRPAATIAAVIKLMSEEHVGAVLVVDDDERLLGVVSERDVVRGLASQGVGLLARDVVSVARRDAPVASLDDSTQQLMECMTRTRARHVPVVRYGRVVGIVSIGDVVKSRLDEQTRENSVLQELARSQFFAS
ncbi:MAG TPA: CBS domain-containing protein [Steroidobacteraceae bacterium]|nr:CBS domain-containing protein [Steroidobacteraceae bacterium]